MSQKSPLRRAFDKQQGKGDQALLKYEQHHLYHIYSSLWRQFRQKKCLLVIRKILGLFVKTLNAGLKYSLFNRENLKKPTQMQLWQKRKLLSEFFSAILKSRTIFKYFPKRDELYSWLFFRNYVLQKTWLNKCLRTLISQDFLKAIW